MAGQVFALGLEDELRLPVTCLLGAFGVQTDHFGDIGSLTVTSYSKLVSCMI